MGAEERMTAHYVYRIFDHQGRLIYVGCTNNLFGRLRVHGRTWWADQVSKVVAKVYPDRPTALAIEREAISLERPRWNLMGSFTHSHKWTRDNFHDYVTATLNQPIITDYTRTHLHNVHRIYRARFGEDLAVAS